MKASIYEPKDKAYEVHEKIEAIRSRDRRAMIVNKKAKIMESSKRTHEELQPPKKLCPDLLQEKNCDCPEKCNVTNATCTISEAVPLVDEGACTVKLLAMKEAEGAQILAENELGSGCASFKRIAGNRSIIITESPDQILFSADCSVSNATCTIPESIPLVDEGECTVKRLAMKQAEGAQILATNDLGSGCATFKRIVPGMDGTIAIVDTPDQIIISAVPADCPVTNAACLDPNSIPLVDEATCTVKRLANTDADGERILGSNEPNCALFKTITEAAVPPDPPVGASILSPISDNDSVYFRNIETDGSLIITTSPTAVNLKVTTQMSPICLSDPDGETSVCVGNDTIQTTADNGMFMVPFNAAPPGAIPIETNGPQMYFYPGKEGAFRAGLTSGGQWFDANVGISSFAVGRDTIASGTQSHAEGFLTVASSNQSHAEGAGSTASGAFSHAEGLNTIASGLISHAEGSSTLASNTLAHAEGFQTQATGLTSHAEGNGTEASGDNSHAEGNTTTASNIASHAEGDNTTASNIASHAEGIGTLASNVAAHAEGISTLATNVAAHAEGLVTVASNIASHAEGQSTTASGTFSHAEGSSTVASGSVSHAEGQLTTASGSFSHAEGRDSFVEILSGHVSGLGTILVNSGSALEGRCACGRFNQDNVPDMGQDRLFMVGNGNGPMSRSNAFTVRISGMCNAGGTFVNGGADYAECFESQDGTSIPPGTSVVLVGNKIVPSELSPSGYLFGVISVNPTVLGNEHAEEWHGRYVRDAEGRIVEEDVEQESIEYEAVSTEQAIPNICFDSISQRYVKRMEKKFINTQKTQEVDIFDENGAFLCKTTIPCTEKRKKIVRQRKESPLYDPSRPYLPRTSRPEWHKVGLVGVVRILKGQRTDSRWYKMRDLDDKYEEWFIR